MILEANNLSRYFGGLKAVDGVSFSVERGEVLGIVGANGSGKTTVLNMLTRLMPVSGGSMKLNGEHYGNVPAHRMTRLGIARTFQNLRLFKDLTTRENIYLTAMTGPRRSSDAMREVDKLLTLAGISEFADVVPASLPYGIQRVIEITRAIAARPVVLFLDEPFAGMSVQEAWQVSQILVTERTERSLSIVIVDHNMEVLVELAERMIVLNEGKLIAEGRPTDVLCEPAVVASYVGEDE